MWICSSEFKNVKPINIFHKEIAPKIEPGSITNHHMLLRKSFIYSGGKVLLSLTADDYYKLYINGKLIGAGPAQAYSFRYFYNTLDITQYLTEGENVLALHVFYIGTLTRAYQSGDMRQGAWFKAEDGNGNTLFESDASAKILVSSAWKEKGLLGYETQFIEDVFAEEIPENWNGIGFDDSRWESACIREDDDHVLNRQETPAVDIYEAKPDSVLRSSSCIKIDFGREVVGTIRFSAKASGKQIIELRMGEELNDDGSVRCPMRCNCDYHIWWHLSGRESDTSDFFDYMCFRYAEIDDPDGVVDENSICVVARNYPMPEDAGLFRCGDPLTNNIFDICRRAVMLGSQEQYQDCPSREKGQYSGDVTITAQSHLLLTGDKRLYQKMLYDFAASDFICKGLMAVAPGGLMQEIADYSCQYPEQIITYLTLTGDYDTARDLMPVVDNLENYFDAYRNADGLIENVTDKWNLVDWPQNLRDDYDFPLTKPIGSGIHNVINAFYYGLKRDADRLREMLGLPMRNEAGAFRKLYIDTFRKEDGLFRDAVGSEHTALHSCVIPLYYGLTEPADVPASVEFIRKKGLCCGVYLAYFVLKALAANGEYDLMNELMFSQDIHSWGNMLKEGATTCYEAWGKDQKWNTSLCHPWASAPVIMLYETVIGIKVLKPGFEEIALEPHAPDFLGDIKAVLRTPKGLLTVERTKGVWETRFC